MKALLQSVLKLYAGAFSVLTSLYCLLAFTPYTYLFLVKEPPYHWLVGFIHYHSILFGTATGAALFAYWPRRSSRLVVAAGALQVSLAVYLSARNFIPRIQENWTAFAISLIVLVPVLLASLADIFGGSDKPQPTHSGFLFSYSNSVVAALAIALASMAGSIKPGKVDPSVLANSTAAFELAFCIIVIYVWLALLLASLLNLVLLAFSKARWKASARRNLVLMVITAGLYVESSRFLQNSLTFGGWQNNLYSLLLSLTLALFGYALLQPLFKTFDGSKLSQKIPLYAVGAASVVAMVMAPAIAGEDDWNGILKFTITTLAWILVPTSIFLLRPRWKTYSAVTILGVLLIAGAVYWGFSASTFLWARQLGTNPGAISRAEADYAAQDVSFNMALDLAGGRTSSPCAELCLTLRQYTNIRQAQAKSDVQLVDDFRPSAGTHPNIFFIVVDSLRQDHVGAYNPRVDFTPNLDALAKDGFALNGFTQYAGTTLSEAAIWTGTLLLHAHYQQPFARLNNLEKLLLADNYQVLLSYDSVLRQLVTDRPELIKFDSEKPWNEVELSETMGKLKSFLDQRKADGRPVFFYTQPLNVHLMAKNHMPLRSPANWKGRPGFDNRIAFEVHQVDQVVGDFISYLKARAMYENSIIIVTADHGEADLNATRSGHSTIIFPEIMRVPLIVHLPAEMKTRLVCSPRSISTLTDITPTLYYLLGHRPIKNNPLFGRPLFTSTPQELNAYPRADFLLASDVRAAYGILSGDGRYMFTLYDSPLHSSLWDLQQDPDAMHSMLTPETEKKYEDRVVEYLQEIAHFYDYHPSGSRELTASR